MTGIKTTMYLETTIHDRLADEAASRGVTMSALATEAVRRHLDRTAPIGMPDAWFIAHSLVDSVADYRIRGEGDE